MIDTGAHVSVISSGLAHFLGLFEEGFTNVSPSPFTVSGYNDAKSYMPILTVNLHLGAKGGEEREISVQFCVLDSNKYKLLIGVDLLDELQFVFDGPNKRLHLANGDKRFSLPVVDRQYAYNSRAVK